VATSDPRTLGRKLADQAIDGIQAAEEWHGDWYGMACIVARSVASRQLMFSSDDVWEALRERGVPATDRRVMGSVMRSLHRDDVAVRTSYTEPSRRPACHSRPVAIWKSLIRKP
jgi:hypothetical protein